MDKNIKIILDDLYSFDKSLKKHEKKLVNIIEQLLLAKPNIKFNKSFQENLRIELIEKFYQVNNKKNNINFMNKIIYVFSSLALVLLILIPSLSKNQIKTVSVDFDGQFQKLGREAFGSLVSDNTEPVDARGESAPLTTNTLDTAVGFGGGGNASSLASDQSSKMIYPNPITYKYVYKGDEFFIAEDQMAVLKKIKGLSSQSQAGQILQSLNFDNIDLQNLDNLKLRNFTVYEDKNFGYSVNVDLYEGMISLNENWEKWPSYNDYPLAALKIEDVPSDSQLISLANKFLQDKNIFLDNYGSPIVDHSWQQNYIRLEEKEGVYIPDMITISYPLIVEGKEVYEEWGNILGLRVSINLRHNRVNNVWNLASQKYQSSLYAMETDVDKILELASMGGNYYYPELDNAKVVEIPLGTPYISYMQTWQYGDNINNELLVPALVFPIMELPTTLEYFYKQNVVIPLPKEILNERIKNRPEIFSVDTDTVSSPEGVETLIDPVPPIDLDD